MTCGFDSFDSFFLCPDPGCSPGPMTFYNSEKCSLSHTELLFLLLGQFKFRLGGVGINLYPFWAKFWPTWLHGFTSLRKEVFSGQSAPDLGCTEAKLGHLWKTCDHSEPTCSRLQPHWDQIQATSGTLLLLGCQKRKHDYDQFRILCLASVGSSLLWND